MNIWILTTLAGGDGDGWYIVGAFTSYKRAVEEAQKHAEDCYVARWKANDPTLPRGFPGPVNNGGEAA